jgi:prophage antirepressor-like protein
MAHAIRVDSPFATAHDTARILGVSKSRTEALIRIAKRSTDRILRDQSSRNGQSVDKVHATKTSATTVVRKSSGRNAGTKASATKSKRAKPRR